MTAYLDTKDNLITIFRDITSYKLTIKELQEKKQHLKKLLNSLDEGVWSHSLPDGRQLFDNLPAKKYLDVLTRISFTILLCMKELSIRMTKTAIFSAK